MSEICSEDYQKYPLIIGSGYSALNHNKSQIEKFNNILRFNGFQNGFGDKKIEETVGFKVDTLVVNTSEISYKYFRERPEWYTDVQNFIVTCNQNARMGVYRLHKMTQILKDWGKKYSILYTEYTSGMSTIMHQLNHYDKVYIIGFDIIDDQVHQYTHYFDNIKTFFGEHHNIKQEKEWLKAKINENKIIILPQRKDK
jgi:hypothetical protein